MVSELVPKFAKIGSLNVLILVLVEDGLGALEKMPEDTNLIRS